MPKLALTLIPTFLLAGTALAAGAALAIEFLDAPAIIPDNPSTLAGTYRSPDHAGFEGWTVLLGQMFSTHQALEVFVHGKTGDLVLMAEWDLPSAADENRPNWIITDALLVGQLGEDQFISGLCETADLPANGMVALGSSSDGEIMDVIEGAWEIDSWTGQIRAVEPTAVTCFTEGGD